MASTNISINTIKDVQEFVAIINKCPYDAIISSGRYVVDAKSIMGIFSIDLSNSVKLKIDCTDEEATETLNKLSKFVVE